MLSCLGLCKFVHLHHHVSIVIYAENHYKSAWLTILEFVQGRIKLSGGLGPMLWWVAPPP